MEILPLEMQGTMPMRGTDAFLICDAGALNTQYLRGIEVPRYSEN